MTGAVIGLHHVTAVSKNITGNVDFYTRILGLRLVKKTVNFDQPSHYHLYFGDERGRPGSVLTLFLHTDLQSGRIGGGQATITSFAVPPDALPFWRRRLRQTAARHVIDETLSDEKRSVFQDPDGLLFALVETEDERVPWLTSNIGSDVAIRGLHGVTLAQQSTARMPEILVDVLGYEQVNVERIGNGHHLRFALPGTKAASIIDVQIDANIARGTDGTGTVHHIAFGVEDEATQASLRKQLREVGLQVSDQRDRTYFKSIYARSPAGILLEIATAGPGFEFDEPFEKLGTSLCLPEHLEARRQEIEALLPPIPTVNDA
ncbi:MAG: ring-cleaving dioxygenase [Hyphomicrobiaceae bacterium]